MPTVRLIAGGAALCLVWTMPALCRAQDAPPTVPPVTGDTKPSEDPADSKKTVAPVGAPVSADLTLLAKAMQTLGNATAFFYEGDVEIKGEGKGLNFTGRERVRFTAKRPGKVSADVMISLGDAPSGKRYVTISDGVKVVVERPGTRQYSVQPFDAKEFTRNLTGLGILGAVYFNRDLLTGVGMITPENADEFVALLKKQNIDLSGTMETVDGIETPVYTLMLARQNMTFRFFVDPKQAVMRRLEVTAHDKDMNFTMTETVVRQNPAPPLAGSVFKFVPPPGYTKTGRITVELL